MWLGSVAPTLVVVCSGLSLPEQPWRITLEWLHVLATPLGWHFRLALLLPEEGRRNTSSLQIPQGGGRIHLGITHPFPGVRMLGDSSKYPLEHPKRERETIWKQHQKSKAQKGSLKRFPIQLIDTSFSVPWVPVKSQRERFHPFWHGWKCKGTLLPQHR